MNRVHDLSPFAAIIVFCLFTNFALAQEEFYYSRGEKIPLTISTEKISIKFKSSVRQTQIDSLLFSERALGELKPLPSTAAPSLFTIGLKGVGSGANVKQIVQRLRKISVVEGVSPVYVAGGLEAIPFDHFIVQFKPSFTRATLDALNNQHHVEVISISTAAPNLYTLRVTSASDLSALEMANLYYENLPCEWSMPDFFMPIELFGIPNDPYFQNQYYLHNTGQTGGVTDADIDAPEAWDISTGSSSITVSVIDEGVASHEDLGGLWTNIDELSGDGNGDGYPGVRNADDDGDGLIDEDSQGREPGEQGYTNDLKDDDDENGYVDDFNGWDFSYNDNDPSLVEIRHMAWPLRELLQGIETIASAFQGWHQTARL